MLCLLGSFWTGIQSVSPEGISYALVAAFFLSNFPEALSSSIIMLENGISRLRIMIMWISIVGNLYFQSYLVCIEFLTMQLLSLHSLTHTQTVITGVGALLGSFLKEDPDAGPNNWHYCLASGIEGVAAGAMLVMISNAMCVPSMFISML